MRAEAWDNHDDPPADFGFQADPVCEEAGVAGGCKNAAAEARGCQRWKVSCASEGTQEKDEPFENMETDDVVPRAGHTDVPHSHQNWCAVWGRDSAKESWKTRSTAAATTT